MIAVADTSPLCYLILIGEIELIPRLFAQVLLPEAVRADLLHDDAPAAVRAWTSDLPSWITVNSDSGAVALGLEKLQAGEREAILLAESMKADINRPRREGRETTRRRSRSACHRHSGHFGRRRNARTRRTGTGDRPPQDDDLPIFSGPTEGDS